MATIMITGGSGFLGTYVTQRLAERGDRVVIFDAIGPIPELAALTAPYENQIVRVRPNPGPRQYFPLCPTTES